MKKYSILLLCFVLSFACKKENSNTNNTNNNISRNEDEKPLDANIVANSFQITDAVVKVGNPPSPSVSSSAPQIRQTPVAKQAIISGVDFKIPINLTNLNVAELGGVYIKVEGSNKYFDVPASSINLRKSSNTHSAFVFNDDTSGTVTINPGDLQPGTFCVSYCVYDAQNQVSNIIQVCYEVEEFGGADFIQGNWHVYKTEYLDIDSNNLPFWYTENYPIQYTDSIIYLDCDSVTNYQFSGNYVTSNDLFWNIGATTQVNQTIYSGQDQDKNFVCANNGLPRVINVEELEELSGGWSYDEDNNRIIFIFNKERSTLKNKTDNIVISDDSQILNQNDVYTYVLNVTNISSNEIRLDYLEPDGTITGKYYLRK